MTERSLWVLRHGETESPPGFRGSIDDELTQAGWMQMEQATRSIDTLDAIVTSPLKRCRLYAGEVAQSRRLPIAIEPDLREIDFGLWEGRSAEELLRDDAARLKAFWRDPRSCTPPQGESFTVFEARVGAAWQRIRERREGNLLVVTHGGPIRLIVLKERGMPFESLLGINIPHAFMYRFTGH